MIFKRVWRAFGLDPLNPLNHLSGHWVSGLDLLENPFLIRQVFVNLSSVFQDECDGSVDLCQRTD
jgi:hypothetical protein